MNASSKQPALTNKLWLDQATTALTEVGIDSARLDADLLLAEALKKNRVWLITHHDELISDEVSEIAEAFLARRKSHEPIAYIIGSREFYGRRFQVTPDTLIPRPETETMIELLAPLIKGEARLIDVGTGSGAIAITAQLEFPHLYVEACDVSDAALSVAKENARALNANVNFRESNLLNEVGSAYDIICANLPYVDRSWDVSEETHAEPDLALYADDHGLGLIKKLVEQATTKLKNDGYLLLEADPRQHGAIVDFAKDHGLAHLKTEGFIVVLQH